jgi:hypothetical protein
MMSLRLRQGLWPVGSGTDGVQRSSASRFMGMSPGAVRRNGDAPSGERAPVSTS